MYIQSPTTTAVEGKERHKSITVILAAKNNQNVQPCQIHAEKSALIGHADTIGIELQITTDRAYFHNILSQTFDIIQRDDQRKKGRRVLSTERMGLVGRPPSSIIPRKAGNRT